MRYLFVTLLLAGCTKSPLYKSGECIDARPIMIVSILNTTEKEYEIYVSSIAGNVHRNIAHKELEGVVKENDLAVVNCDELK